MVWSIGGWGNHKRRRLHRKGIDTQAEVEEELEVVVVEQRIYKYSIFMVYVNRIFLCLYIIRTKSGG